MSTIVHSRGEGVKIGQNLVHVVVECPPKAVDRYDVLLPASGKKRCHFVQ